MEINIKFSKKYPNALDPLNSIVRVLTITITEPKTKQYKREIFVTDNAPQEEIISVYLREALKQYEYLKQIKML